MTMTGKTLTASRFKENRLLRFYKNYLLDSILMVKNHGFRGLQRRRGWKYLLVIVLYYLVRDTVLYIIVPFFIAKSLMD